MGNNMNSQPHNAEVRALWTACNTHDDARDDHVANDSVRRNADKDKVLVGIFETENEAIHVINQLKEAGYQEDEITVLAKDKEMMDYIEETTGADIETQRGGGKAGTGATIGAVLGGVAAALPALGLLVIPGVGPFLAAGPIAVILGGVIAGGVAGGLIGALVKLGVNEEDARIFENDIEQGKILVLVEKWENLSEAVQNIFTQSNSHHPYHHDNNGE